MPTHRKPKYTSQLPATPVEPPMRERMLEIAESRGESLAQIQRDAFSLFLVKNYSNTIVENSNPIELMKGESTSL